MLHSLVLFTFLLLGTLTLPFLVLQKPAPRTSLRGEFEDALASLNKQQNSLKSFSQESGTKFVVPNGIGIGTLSWGDKKRGFTTKTKITKKYKNANPGVYNAGDLSLVYSTLTKAGIRFVDTSEIYGLSSLSSGQSSEELIGKFGDIDLEGIATVKGTKISWSWMNFMGRRGSSGILKAIQDSCDRLSVGYVDLYQVPFPFPYIGGQRKIIKGLKLARDRGLTNHFGVANLNGKKLMSMAKLFASQDLEIASNQIEFSLLNRKAMFDGTLETCKRLGIVVLAAKPLGGGLACGKYTAMNPTGGKIGTPKYSFNELDPLSPLHNALRQVAIMVQSRLKDEHDSAEKNLRKNFPVPEITTSMVAINWVVAKGAVPLCGVSRNDEANEVVDCLGWKLSSAELERLDDACDEMEGR